MFVSVVMSIYYIYIMAYCLIYLCQGFGNLPWLEGPELELLSRTKDYYLNTVLQKTTENVDYFHVGYSWRGELDPLSFRLGLLDHHLLLHSQGNRANWQDSVGHCVASLCSVVHILDKVLSSLPRVSTLSGFSTGLIYLLKPDFSKLFTVDIWKDAMIQVFFQLSLGQGCMITFASFRDVKEKIVLPTRLIPVINSLTGILASLIIFGYLGYFCEKYGLEIQNLPIAGPGLLFITFPACLSTMIWPNLWVVLFFFTMILLGIDTQFALVETFCFFTEDLLVKFGKHQILPEKVRMYICILIFIIGLPIATGGGTYIIDMMDTFGYSIPASFINLFQVYIWVKITDFDSGMQKLFAQTRESFPSIDRFCLENTSFGILVVLVVFCFYTTIRDGAFMGVFTPWFTVIGLVILSLTMLPVVYFYHKYSGEPVNSTPFAVLADDHVHRDRLPEDDADGYYSKRDRGEDGRDGQRGERDERDRREQRPPKELLPV